MTLDTLSFLLGGVLVLSGILGGGFEVKELRIPKISGWIRLVAVVAGLAFIGLGFRAPHLLDANDELAKSRTMSRMEVDIDRPGSDLVRGIELPAADPQLCLEMCRSNRQCEAWTYVRPNTIQGPAPRCWLKHSIPPPQPAACCVSGTKL